MATNGETLTAIISADITEFSTKLDQAVSKLESTGASFEKIGKSLSMKLTAPLTALAGVMVKTASDVEELQSKFNYIFKDQAGAVSEWAEEVGTSMGRSKYQMQQFASDMRGIFTAVGSTAEESTKLSQQFSELAVDLGSFYNASDEQALQALRSLMIGNTEAARNFNIIVTESTMQQEALRQGINKSYSDLTEYEKVMLRVSIALNSTKDASGDAVRTFDSFANQMKALQADLKDLAVEFGQTLLPVAKDIVALVREWVSNFKGLSDETKKTIVIIASLVAAIGPLLIILGSMVTALNGLSIALKGISVAVGAINPLLLVLGSTLLVGVKAWNDYTTAVNNFNTARAETEKILNNGFNIENDKEKIKETTEMYEEYIRVQEEAKNLGGTGYIQADKFGSEYYIVRDEEAYKKLNMTQDEYIKKITTIEQRGKKVSIYLKDNAMNIDELEEAYNLANNSIAEQNRLLEENERRQKALTDIKSNNSNRRTDLDNKTNELETLRKTSAQIMEAVESYKILSAQTKITNAEEEQLLSLQEYLKNAIGENIFVIDKNTGKLKVNEAVLKNFNGILEDTIALSRNDITLKIRTIIEEPEKELSNIRQQIYDTEQKLKSSVSYQGSVILGTNLNSLKAQEQAVMEEMAMNSEAAKKATEESIDEILNSINSKYKSSSGSGKDYKAEAEQKLRDSIDREITLLDYRYNTEKIKQEELLSGLKKNLETYKKYYGEHLSEELQMRERIYNLEQEMARQDTQKQIDALEDANDKIIDGLNEKRKKIDEDYRKEIQNIENKKNEELKALREVVDAREDALSVGRAEDRIAQIDAVIGRYQKSASTEGQQRFIELLQERQDLEIKIQRLGIKAQEKEIEKKYDNAKTIAENQYNSDVSLIEKEETLIKNNYQKLLNELNGITETQIKATEKLISDYNTKLMAGVKELETSVNTVKTTSQNTTTTKKNSLFSLDDVLNVIKDRSQILKDINFKAPSEALTGSIYNINNNVVVNVGGVNINGTNSEEMVEAVGKIIGGQVKNSLKEVM